MITYNFTEINTNEEFVKKKNILISLYVTLSNLYAWQKLCFSSGTNEDNIVRNHRL